MYELPFDPRTSFEIEQNGKHDILSSEGFIIFILMILRCKEGGGVLYNTGNPVEYP